MAARRRRPPGRRAPSSGGGSRSDFGARVLAALPAIAFAIFIVYEGGLVFALGVLALGIICMGELFSMLRTAQPVRLAGFLGITALVLAALYGSQFQVVLVEAALIPVLFVMTLLMPRHEEPTLGMAVTLFGVWWIGLALAHAVLLRELPHGDGIVVDVLVGTFIGEPARTSEGASTAGGRSPRGCRRTRRSRGC